MRRFKSCSALLALVLLITTACSSEDLSNYTYYDSAWCVVYGKGSQMALVTDNKGILRPSEALDSTRFKAGDRYRVVYIPLGNSEYYTVTSGAKLVEITNFQPVLVEEVIQRTNFNGAVNDPVWVNADPFFGGGYLNFDFSFYSSETGIKHGIHLLQDSLVNRKLYLRFGHDANNDTNSKTASALASFPIRSLKNYDLADSLIIQMRNVVKLNTYRLALRDTI